MIIPGEPNQRTREQAIRNSLSLAIAHAEGREWTERPAYQNGLAAYDLWATVFDRWALLVEAGKAHKLTPSLPDHAAYYAQHYYSARCYARNYLHDIANGSDDLLDAFRAYARVAVTLPQVWDAFPRTRHPNEALLRSLASSIRSAKTAEQEGLDHRRRHLSG